MRKVLMSLMTLTVAVGMVTSAAAQGAGPKGGAQGVAPGQKGQQGRPGGMRMGGRKMQEEIFAKLNLSVAQKTKITALQDSFRKQMEAMRPKDGKATPPTPQQREKMTALFKKHNDSMMAVFTPQQKVQYEKLMAEAREKFRKQRGPNGGTKPPTGGKTGGKGGTKPPTK